MSETRSLVARLLSSPGITRIVPQLPPEVLHRVIDRCGLEACAEIVALATPRQLQRLLDIDLWRPPVPGADEQLDAGRFGEWLELLIEMPPAMAVERVAAMDLDVFVAGLSAQVRAFDGAQVAPYLTLEGERVDAYEVKGPLVAEVGGFVLRGRRALAWDVVIAFLAMLHSEDPALFHGVMRRCVALSPGTIEADASPVLLHARDQHDVDIAAEREARRDRQGYVAPAQARAFLHAARTVRLDAPQPRLDPVAQAWLRDAVPEPLQEAEPGPAGHEQADTMASVMEMLAEEGLVGPPRALLPPAADGAVPLALVRDAVASHPTAPEELAFLTNALLSGCALNGAPFTAAKASDAVLATCNLGLENWPAAWPPPDLVTAFQVGWGLLYRDLCCHATEALIDALAGITCADPDLHWSLQTLRRELMRYLRHGEPWHTRETLDSILALDPVAWGVLLALIDECPGIHAGVETRRLLSVDPAAVRFAACNADIAAARAWLATLPVVLAG